MKKGVYFIDLTLIRFENSPYNFVCTLVSRMTVVG